MPHAEKTNGLVNGHTDAPTVNGDGPHSQFVQHLTSYPVISSSISTYSTNQYGAKSIDLFNTLYATFLQRIYGPASPYLARPRSIVAPYLSKADELGDNGLTKLETRFPIVKDEPSTLREKAGGLVGWPLGLAQQGREYVFKTYSEELNKEKKNTGEKDHAGYLTIAKAAFHTELRITSEVLARAAGFANEKTETVREKGQKKGQEIKEKTNEATA